MPLRKPEACPKCRTKNILRIYYGRPLPEAWRAVKAGEAIAGGFLVSPWAPDWHCAGCRHRWYDVDDPEKQRQEAELQKINDRQDVSSMASAFDPAEGREPIFGVLSCVFSFIGIVLIAQGYIRFEIGASRFYGDDLIGPTFFSAIGGVALALVARCRSERYWGIPWAAFIIGLLVLFFLIASTYPEYFSYL